MRESVRRLLLSALAIMHLGATAIAGKEEIANPSEWVRDITLLYGPTTSLVPDTLVYASPSDSLPSVQKTLGPVLRSGKSSAYLLLCSGQMLELGKRSSLGIDFETPRLVLKTGTMTIHAEDRADSLCFPLEMETAVLRNASRGKIEISVGDSLVELTPGAAIVSPNRAMPGGDWWLRSERDGRYVFQLLRSKLIPDDNFDFEFPSRRKPGFRHRTVGEVGVAGYQKQVYYLGSVVYRLRAPKFEFAYDFWFAMSKDGAFYREAWDEWKDLVDHIHHIQWQKRGYPFYLRIGIIEKLTSDHGLVVENYNNSVFLPFEKLNGLEIALQRNETQGIAFINDIGRPRVIGTRISWVRDEVTGLSVGYAGDFDQLSNLDDSDGDSYPDRVDPEPDRFNSREDSIIIADSTPSLNDVESSQLHSLFAGVDHLYRDTKTTQIRVSGEAAVLSKIGSGVTFPNVSVEYRDVKVGLGFDLQTPRFVAGIFDRNYEFDKARVVEEEDGSMVLKTRGEALSETKDWLWGWNNSFRARLWRDLRFDMKFRDVHRGDERDKSLLLSLENTVPLSKYRVRSALFLEQKNVSEILQKRTHGQNWGVDLTLYPHHTVRVKLRFRERFDDENGNGSIGSGEVERNLSTGITVDGNYWWDRLEEWWENRKKSKRDSPASGESTDPD